MAKRIYCVTSNEGDSDLAMLVRASTPSQALAFAARRTYATRVASQDDIVKAMRLGEPVHEHGEDKTDALD